MNATCPPNGISTGINTVSALSRLSRQRDAEAWAAILHEHGARILAVAQRVTSDRALSDDICQETLLQIRANAGRFSPPAPPQDAEASARGWIMRIATCTALKMLRSRMRSDKRANAAVSSAAISAPSAVETAVSNEQAELVRREVADLPETLREPVSLRYFAELDYPEVSLALGCSQDAAKKRVQRGIALLRERLAVCGVALSLGAITSSLGSSSAHATEMIATETGATMSCEVSNFAQPQQILDAQRLAEWQALLNSSAAPALSGVAVFGGMTLMAKFGLVAALLALTALAGFETARSMSIQKELTQTREITEQNSKLIQEMRVQAAERSASLAALQKTLVDREFELQKVQSKLADLEQKADSHKLAGIPGIQINDDLLKQLPAGARQIFTKEFDLKDLKGNLTDEQKKLLENLKNLPGLKDMKMLNGTREFSLPGGGNVRIQSSGMAVDMEKMIVLGEGGEIKIGIPDTKAQKPPTPPDAQNEKF